MVSVYGKNSGDAFIYIYLNLIDGHASLHINTREMLKLLSWKKKFGLINKKNIVQS